MNSPSTNLVAVSPNAQRGSAFSVAQMRSVYRCDDVERRLNKLPPKDHEHLRGTYERMLQKGPERFQVKPSGLPAMEHLYDELPNFHLVLDDIRRSLRCATTAATHWKSPRCCCWARPAWARRISRARWPGCWAPAWASSR